jgi:hypothetical protein
MLQKLDSDRGGLSTPSLPYHHPNNHEGDGQVGEDNAAYSSNHQYSCC